MNEKIEPPHKPPPHHEPLPFNKEEYDEEPKGTVGEPKFRLKKEEKTEEKKEKTEKKESSFSPFERPVQQRKEEEKEKPHEKKQEPKSAPMEPIKPPERKRDEMGPKEEKKFHPFQPQEKTATHHHPAAPGQTPSPAPKKEITPTPLMPPISKQEKKEEKLEEKVEHKPLSSPFTFETSSKSKEKTPEHKPLPSPFAFETSSKSKEKTPEHKPLPSPFTFVTSSKSKEKTPEHKPEMPRPPLSSAEPQKPIEKRQAVQAPPSAHEIKKEKEHKVEKKEEVAQPQMVQQTAPQEFTTQTGQPVHEVHRTESITSVDTFVKLVQSVYSNESETHVHLKDGTVIEIQRETHSGALSILVKTPQDQVREVVEKNSAAIVERLKERANITVNSIRTESDYTMRDYRRVEKMGEGEAETGGGDAGGGRER